MAVMCISGFAGGVIMPSRDMIVREVTPPGLFGTVFGFVTTGFNVAGVVFPLVFGAMMDHGNPRAVFYRLGGMRHPGDRQRADRAQARARLPVKVFAIE